MPVMKHEYPIRTGMNGSFLETVTIELASSALHLSTEILDQLLDYSKAPPEDAIRDRLIGYYDGLIGHVYDWLLLDGLARATCRRYAEEFGKFVNWAQKHVQGDITTADVEAYLDYRYKEIREECGASSDDPENQAGMGVKRFAFYALKKILDQLFKMSLFKGLRPPPRPRPIPAASEETVATLAKKIETVDDLLAFLLINCLKLRPGIAVALTWDNFDEEFRYVNFDTAYGEKSEYIPLAFRPALRALERNAVGNTAVLLPTQNGAGQAPITVRTLEYRLGRMAETCGVPEHLIPTALQKARGKLPPHPNSILAKAV